MKEWVRKDVVIILTKPVKPVGLLEKTSHYDYKNRPSIWELLLVNCVSKLITGQSRLIPGPWHYSSTGVSVAISFVSDTWGLRPTVHQIDDNSVGVGRVSICSNVCVFHLKISHKTPFSPLGLLICSTVLSGLNGLWF